MDGGRLWGRGVANFAERFGYHRSKYVRVGGGLPLLFVFWGGDKVPRQIEPSGDLVRSMLNVVTNSVLMIRTTAEGGRHLDAAYTKNIPLKCIRNLGRSMGRPMCTGDAFPCAPRHHRRGGPGLSSVVRSSD